MLRDSLRGFLEAHWVVGGGKERSSQDTSAIWGKLVGQGIAALGSSRDDGGLREILVVMAELGRAACPVPMWSTALANLALSGLQADVAGELLEKLHAGTAMTAFSFGACDPDAGAGSI
ncbi:MAG: acyl-CoA dehydrogenase, partial [Bradyrhizobium guangdongense]